MKEAIRTGLVVTVMAVTLMLGITYLTAQNLPADNIPLHWNAAGEVDRWGTRGEALLMQAILPIATIIVGLIMAIAPRMDPRGENLQKSAKAYLITWVATFIFLTGIHAGIAYLTVSSLESGAPPTIEMIRFIIASAAILIILIGNYLPKTRPNWFLGIRTPWTLSSDDTWERTHRIGGRLFMLVGFITLVAAFTLTGRALALTTPVMMVSVVLFCIVYSYRVWRTASDKHV